MERPWPPFNFCVLPLVVNIFAIFFEILWVLYQYSRWNICESSFIPCYTWKKPIRLVSYLCCFKNGAGFVAVQSAVRMSLVDQAIRKYLKTVYSVLNDRLLDLCHCCFPGVEFPSMFTSLYVRSYYDVDSTYWQDWAQLSYTYSTMTVK